MPDRTPTASACPDLADLLLASEGELPRRRQRETDAHLRQCAYCREQLGDAALSIREYHEARTADVDSASDSTGRFERFRERLRQDRHPKFHQSMSVRGRHWLPVAAAIPVIVVALFFSNQYSTVVSAEEFLTRAAAQEHDVPVGTVRRLEIRVRRVPRAAVTYADDTRRSSHQNASVWSMRRDVGGIAPVPVDAQAEGAESQELARLLEVHRLDLSDPLSVRGFRAWRESRSTRTDRVLAFADTFVLRTTTTDGTLRSAELVVRRLDFQPVRETLDFADLGQIEIVEVSRWVTRRAATTARTTAPETAATLASTAPSAAAFDETEVDVRRALHDLRADENSQLMIARLAEKLEVRGTVDVTRKADITRALNSLGPVPVETRLRTRTTDSSEGLSIDPIAAPLQTWLERRFGRGERASTFLPALAADAEQLQRRTQAFAALASRYPAAAVSRMSPAAQRKLTALAAAQYRDVVNAVEVLDDRLALFLGTTTRQAADRELSASWQARAVAVSQEAERVIPALRDLLAEKDVPLPIDLREGQEPLPLASLRQATGMLWEQLRLPR